MISKEPCLPMGFHELPTLVRCCPWLECEFLAFLLFPPIALQPFIKGKGRVKISQSNFFMKIFIYDKCLFIWIYAKFPSACSGGFFWYYLAIQPPPVPTPTPPSLLCFMTIFVFFSLSSPCILFCLCQNIIPHVIFLTPS